MGDKAAEVTRGQMDSAVTIVRTRGFVVRKEARKCEPGLLLPQGGERDAGGEQQKVSGDRGGTGRSHASWGEAGGCTEPQTSWQTQFISP